MYQLKIINQTKLLHKTEVKNMSTCMAWWANNQCSSPMKLLSIHCTIIDVGKKHKFILIYNKSMCNLLDNKTQIIIISIIKEIFNWTVGNGWFTLKPQMQIIIPFPNQLNFLSKLNRSSNFNQYINYPMIINIFIKRMQ